MGQELSLKQSFYIARWAMVLGMTYGIFLGFAFIYRFLDSFSMFLGGTFLMVPYVLGLLAVLFIDRNAYGIEKMMFYFLAVLYGMMVSYFLDKLF